MKTQERAITKTAIRFLGLLLFLLMPVAAMAGAPPFLRNSMTTNFYVPEMLNVRNPPFNATGDGVTDDTEAFRAALSRPFANVYCPTGVYSVSTIEVTNSYVRLFGDGFNSKLINRTANPVIRVSSGAASIRFDSFYIDGTFGPSVPSHGILLTNNSGSRNQFKNLRIVGCGTGIGSITGSFSLVFDRCEINNNRVGIDLPLGAQNSRIDHCLIYYNTNYQVILGTLGTRSVGISITDTEMEHSPNLGTNLLVRDVEALALHGCYFESSFTASKDIVIEGSSLVGIHGMYSNGGGASTNSIYAVDANSKAELRDSYIFNFMNDPIVSTNNVHVACTRLNTVFFPCETPGTGGGISNLFSPTLSNATIKPLVVGIGNAAGATNNTGQIRGLEAGGNVTLAENGSNVVITATVSGSGISTNGDQFGPSIPITIKSGALLTNLSTLHLTNRGDTLLQGNTILGTNGWTQIGDGVNIQLVTNHNPTWQRGQLVINDSGQSMDILSGAFLEINNGSTLNMGMDTAAGTTATKIQFQTNAYILSGTDAEINRYRFAADNSGNDSNKVVRVKDLTALQPGSTTLTNLAGTGAVTNLFSPTLSNATIKPLVVGIGNAAGATNTSGHIRGIEAGGNVTLTENGSNIVIAASVSGSGISTNGNQFGESVELTIKDGAFLTNLNVETSLQVSNGHTYLAGPVTNLTQLNLPHLTTSRSAIINAQGDITNSSADANWSLYPTNVWNNRQGGSVLLSNLVANPYTGYTNEVFGGTNISVRTAGGTNFIDTIGFLNNWSLYPTNVWNSRQGGSQTLTNLAGTGAITNLFSPTLSNATIKPLVVGIGDAAGATNTTGQIRGLQAGSNVTLSENGSNVVITATLSGGSVTFADLVWTNNSGTLYPIAFPTNVIFAPSMDGSTGIETYTTNFLLQTDHYRSGGTNTLFAVFNGGRSAMVVGDQGMMLGSTNYILVPHMAIDAAYDVAFGDFPDKLISLQMYNGISGSLCTSDLQTGTNYARLSINANKESTGFTAFVTTAGNNSAQWENFDQVLTIENPAGTFITPIQVDPDFSLSPTGYLYGSTFRITNIHTLLSLQNSNTPVFEVNGHGLAVSRGMPNSIDGAFRAVQNNARGYSEFTVTNSVIATNRFVWSFGSNTVAAGHVAKVHSTAISDGINNIVITNDTDNAGGGGLTTNANQFGAAVELAIKSGALLTNTLHYPSNLTGPAVIQLASVGQGTNLTEWRGTNGAVALTIGSNGLYSISIPLLHSNSIAFRTNFVDFNLNQWQTFSNALRTNLVVQLTNCNDGVTHTLDAFGAGRLGNGLTNAWQMLCTVASGNTIYWPPGTTNGNYDVLVNSNQVVTFSFRQVFRTNIFASYLVREGIGAN